MPERTSRTYKLKLSPKGVGLFLDCHSRLCHLICDFLPYGTTLQIAVALLERASIHDILAEITSADITTLGGSEIRYVGASPSLMESATRIAQRIDKSGGLFPIPQTWKIYITALLILKSSEDALILRSYADLAQRIDRRT